MKLAFADTGFKIEFKENQIEHIIFENQKIYREFLQELHAECNGAEGSIIISEKDTVLPFSKNVYLIENPMILDFKDKKIISRLYENLKSVLLESSSYELFNELMSKLQLLILKLDDLSIFPIEGKDEIDPVQLFKFLDIRISADESTFAENLLHYIKIVSELLNVKLIIINDLRGWLTDDETVELYKMLNYCKIQILVVANHEYKMLEYEHRYVIDNDMCLLY